MASQGESTNRGVDRRADRCRASASSGHDGAEHQILTLSRYCVVCNLTFGRQERRVLLGEKAAHPACASKARRLEAA